MGAGASSGKQIDKYGADSEAAAAEHIRKGGSLYAVAVGHTPGVYTGWADCQAQVAHYHHGNFRSFSGDDALKHAKAFVEEHAKAQLLHKSVSRTACGWRSTLDVIPKASLLLGSRWSGLGFARRCGTRSRRAEVGMNVPALAGVPVTAAAAFGAAPGRDAAGGLGRRISSAAVSREGPRSPRFRS